MWLRLIQKYFPRQQEQGDDHLCFSVSAPFLPGGFHFLLSDRKAGKRLLGLHADRFEQLGLSLLDLDDADLVETIAIRREDEGP